MNFRDADISTWVSEGASKMCLCVLNYAAVGSCDSLNLAKGLAGSSRYFQAHTLLPVFSKLANFRVMMDECLSHTR